MPRPLRSAVREVFVAVLLLALAVALPGARSTPEVVLELLALCLLVGIALATALARLRRRVGAHSPRAELPPR